MIATDSIKILATRTGIARSAIRAAAKDLGLAIEYSAARRTYVIAEDAATVRAFNEHIAN